MQEQSQVTYQIAYGMWLVKWVYPMAYGMSLGNIESQLTWDAFNLHFKTPLQSIVQVPRMYPAVP